MQLLKRLREWISLGEPVEYDYDPGQSQSAPTPMTPPTTEYRDAPRRRERSPVTTTPEPSTSRTPMNNVIGLPTAHNQPFEVVVMEPRSFEEMPQAIQALRERKSVVLNVTLMEPELAQRAVDFVAGGTYAIDGHQERLGESIFLFTPSGVQVTTRTSIPNPTPLEAPSSLRNTPPIWTPESMPAYLAQ
ncbi:MAG: cell division protein SepF [Gloeomargarita sp. SKYBB_i_bin120]|nr:cell division protein SepF [Gloeomargarita sp. SKYG98]MCS7291789.1 cell division protein SepF [Gloeomargarita sp. SKYB120]MDW8177349.1 cell division protein SepF [Gloeomargarita sp. SKYBB_i_bin120]